VCGQLINCHQFYQCNRDATVSNRNASECVSWPVSARIPAAAKEEGIGRGKRGKEGVIGSLKEREGGGEREV